MKYDYPNGFGLCDIIQLISLETVLFFSWYVMDFECV